LETKSFAIERVIKLKMIAHAWKALLPAGAAVATTVGMLVWKPNLLQMKYFLFNLKNV